MIVDKSKYNFANQKEYYRFLVKHKEELIALKKAAVKFSDVEHSGVLSSNTVLVKSESQQQEDVNSGVIKRTIVGNTYNWMDSHSDVHIRGIFTKTINENKKAIMHLHDHEYKLTSKVGVPVDIYEGEILWRDLGIDKDGATTSLMMESEIKRAYNEMIFDDYVNKQINQHSVGMIYVKLFMCINDKEMKEEYANWNTYFPFVGNPEKALEEGVFWAVTEAKLKEISCVIQGSNTLTPTLEPKGFTQADATEPSFDTRKINYDYLTNHFKL